MQRRGWMTNSGPYTVEFSVISPFRETPPNKSRPDVSAWRQGVSKQTSEEPIIQPGW